MRVPGRLIAFAVVAVVAAGFASGQQFGGFGGGFKKGSDYFAVANSPLIRKEIKITDEQAAKMPAAAQKAVAEVLDAGQMKRLKQIYLQQRGNVVYLEADVRKELKITDEQAKKINSALETQAKDQKEMFANGFDFERSQEIQKTADEAVQAALSADQKAAWTKLTGEPFEFPAFKGFKKNN